MSNASPAAVRRQFLILLSIEKVLSGVAVVTSKVTRTFINNEIFGKKMLTRSISVGHSNIGLSHHFFFPKF